MIKTGIVSWQYSFVAERDKEKKIKVSDCDRTRNSIEEEAFADTLKTSTDIAILKT